MNLRTLLFIHAIITFLAGIVLIAAPAAIPAAAGITLPPQSNLVCYLLGSAEIALAFLSFFARRITDPESLRLISRTFIVFHGSAALVEVYAYTEGVNAAVWLNVVLRAAVILLFVYSGLRKRSQE